MPLTKDPQGGGSNADASKSTMHRSHCFVNGKFTAPDLDAAETQALVREKLLEMCFPGFVCGFFTRRIPKLARWR